MQYKCQAFIIIEYYWRWKIIHFSYLCSQIVLIFYAAIITIVLVTNCHRFKNESFQFKIPRRKDILVNSDSSLRILDPNKDVPNYSSINEESNVWVVERIFCGKKTFLFLIYIDYVNKLKYFSELISYFFDVFICCEDNYSVFCMSSPVWEIVNSV
jgi:hypothetical protein